MKVSIAAGIINFAKKCLVTNSLVSSHLRWQTYNPVPDSSTFPASVFLPLERNFHFWSLHTSDRNPCWLWSSSAFRTQSHGHETCCVNKGGCYLWLRRVSRLREH